MTGHDPEYREYDPIQPSGFDWRGALKKLWAPVAVVVALAFKFGAAGLKFGSIFIAVTFNPLALRTVPIDDEVMPLPRPDKTPPETTITFIPISRGH